MEAIGDRLPDHLPSGHEFGVQPVQNILEVLSFPGFLRVEQFEELLDEPVGNEHLQGFDIRGFLGNELQEELVDGLKVRPGGVDQQVFFFHHGHALGRWRGLLEHGQGTEEVLLDHLHHELEVRDDQGDEAVLLVDQLDELLEYGKPLVLKHECYGDIWIKKARSTFSLVCLLSSLKS